MNRESMSKSESYSASDTLDKVKTIHIQSMYSVMLVYFCSCNLYAQAYCEFYVVGISKLDTGCNLYAQAYCDLTTIYLSKRADHF